MPSERQIVAIKVCWAVAEKLQRDLPGIAEMYRSGMSRTRIEDSLRIGAVYGLSPELAQTAITVAIAGHKEGYGFDQLTGLIDDPDELRRIGEEHNSISGVDQGMKTLREGTGLFSLTTEERQEHGRKVYREGKGLAALLPEQRVSIGKKSAMSRGQTPWVEASVDRISEKERLFELYQARVDTARAPISILEQIRVLINQEYHGGREARSISSIKHVLNKIKGKKRIKHP